MVEFQPVREHKIADIFWNPKPKPDTPDLLMSLPGELRNTIYDLVDRQMHASWNRRRYLPSDDDPALLKTSRQIRAEASSHIFAITHTIVFVKLCNDRVDKMAHRIGQIVSFCGTRPFNAFSIRFDGPLPALWEHLHGFLPFLEMMRDTGFEPFKAYEMGDAVRPSDKARSLESASHVIEFYHDITYRIMKEVLGRAIALGRRARDEGWSKAKLEERWTDFVAFAKKGPKVYRKGQRPRKWPAVF